MRGWLYLRISYAGAEGSPSGSKCMKSFMHESTLRPTTFTSFNHTTLGHCRIAGALSRSASSSLQLGWSVGGKMAIAREHGRDHKFYVILLNFLIDSFTQYWSTHYMYPERAAVVYHTTEGRPLTCTHYWMKLKGEFVWNDMIRSLKTCWTSGI